MWFKWLRLKDKVALRAQHNVAVFSNTSVIKRCIFDSGAELQENPFYCISS